MLIRITGPATESGPAAPIVASFGTFVADNLDALKTEGPSPQALYERLRAGATVQLGGGGAPLVTLEALGAEEHDAHDAAAVA